LVATAVRSANQKTQKIPSGIICCPRQSTAIQPHTDNFSGPPRRLLARHRLFRLVISLLSRPPATGAAPYELRLPAQKIYLLMGLAVGAPTGTSAAEIFGRARAVTHTQTEAFPGIRSTSGGARAAKPAAHSTRARRAVRAGRSRRRAMPRVWPSSPKRGAKSLLAMRPPNLTQLLPHHAQPTDN